MKGVHAELKMLNGAPALHINGTPMFLNAPYLPKSTHASFIGVGTGMYLVGGENGDNKVDVVPDNEPETASWKERVSRILEKEPNALIIFRSFPCAPRWWLDAHPDEELRFDRDIRGYQGCANYRDVSWASDVWLESAVKWYGAWCKTLRDAFPDNVIGFQFGMGSSGENNPLGCPDGRWFCSDFSAAAIRYFRTWLKNKYGAIEQLRAAWSEPDVCFETAAPPDRVARLKSDWFTFRSPVRAQVADYYQAMSERVEHCVIVFCETIKKVTDGHCIAGSHLGALMDNGFYGYLYAQTSINMVHRALKHPAVDTFTSPASYDNRQPGGDATSMMPAGSMSLNGKMIFQDQDTRTSLVTDEYRRNFTLARIAANFKETADSLKRDFAHMLIRGYGMWWHAMKPGMYDHPEIKKCLTALAGIGNKSLRFPRGTADGIAMIVDEESAFHQQCANRLLFSSLYFQRQRHWSCSGAAWNVYLHNDLEHPNMPDHKLYYFLNTFYLTDADIEAIEQKVKKNNATVIWGVAPGIQGPAGFSLERVRRLTGFHVKSVDAEALTRITFTDYNHPCVQYKAARTGDSYHTGAARKNHLGTGPMGTDERERTIGPIIYVDDPEATVLGEIDALQEPGFCIKQMDGWTSIFLAAPMLDQHTLASVAASAGVHIYSDQGDVVLPGKSFLMIHARTSGMKKITFPEPTDVFECYDERMVARNALEITENMEAFETRLFFLGDDKAYAG